MALCFFHALGDTVAEKSAETTDFSQTPSFTQMSGTDVVGEL